MSNKQRRVYVVQEDWEYMNWIIGSRAKSIEDADLVIFSGGADVSSHLYGKKQHYTAYSNPARDAYEVKAFALARQLKKPILGVCRGAQLCAVLSGAKLVQHQDNPYAIHPITTDDGRIIQMSSTHHQGVWPWELSSDQFKVLAWTKDVSSFHYGEDDDDEMVTGLAPEDKEVEIAYFPLTQALSIQGHPEYLTHQHAYRETISYCRELVDKLLAGAL